MNEVTIFTVRRARRKQAGGQWLVEYPHGHKSHLSKQELIDHILKYLEDFGDE